MDISDMTSASLVSTDMISRGLEPEVKNLQNRLEALRKPEQAASAESTEFPDNKKKKIAKDFESVLLVRLFKQMKETVGDWGFEEDGASKQIQGMFWMFLARDVADKGGFGLWKDIYKFIDKGNMPSATGADSFSGDNADSGTDGFSETDSLKDVRL